MPTEPTIRSIDSPALDELVARLAAAADSLDATGSWPAEQLAECGRHGVLRWNLPTEAGGFEWSDADHLTGLARLASGCLSTTFCLTQPIGAARRIVDSDNEWLKSTVLPQIARGDAMASVGISHLTTSRQHVAQPAMTARSTDGGYLLQGEIPWVTGGGQASYVVTGAVLQDGRQLLVLLPMDSPGVAAEPPARLVGLSATHTGPVRCNDVELDDRWLLAGPLENVLGQGRGAGTGGLQTSALALGLADAAIGYLEESARQRGDLSAPARSLREQWNNVQQQLLALAAGRQVCTSQQLRGEANRLVLHATQAALTAAKGAGYVVGHPAGRWCREALFFLVWSCPQPVAAAALCELAGLQAE